MTKQGREHSSHEEMALAQEELQAAQKLIEAGLARVAMTRVYFASFHAVRACLYNADLEPRTHQGAHHLFNLHFVKTERFPAGTSRLLARLQKYREEADYGESFVVDDAGAREELEAAQGFVASIQAHMASD